MSLDLSLIPTLTLFVMMLAMGMTLGVPDFTRVVTRPLGFAVGAVGQLIVLPLVAFAIARGFSLSAELAIGLMLIAACPGGVTSNAVTYLARGDTALSILLTVFSSLLAFLSVPIVVNLGLIGFGLEAGEIRLPFGETAITLFTTTALPVFIGMFVRARWPGVAGDWHRPLLYGSFAALMLMVLSLGVSLMGEDLTSLLMGGSLPVALLIAVMMSLGLAASRAVGLAPAQRRTVAIELGLQNFTLALVLAFSILEEPRYLGPALLYLPTMFAAVGLLVAVARISDRERSPPGPARSPQTRTPG